MTMIKTPNPKSDEVADQVNKVTIGIGKMMSRALKHKLHRRSCPDLQLRLKIPISSQLINI